MTHNLE